MLPWASIFLNVTPLPGRREGIEPPIAGGSAGFLARGPVPRGPGFVGTSPSVRATRRTGLPEPPQPTEVGESDPARLTLRPGLGRVRRRGRGPPRPPRQPVPERTGAGLPKDSGVSGGKAKDDVLTFSAAGEPRKTPKGAAPFERILEEGFTLVESHRNPSTPEGAEQPA